MHVEESVNGKRLKFFGTSGQNLRCTEPTALPAAPFIKLKHSEQRSSNGENVVAKKVVKLT